jgi:hypothetical protein
VFIEQAGRYVLMAMMSPMPGHNLFVGPDGEWLGGYAPSSLRSHPFRLVRREGSEQMSLYIDEDSGVISDADEAGEPFFAADGKPSPSISTIVEFLRQIEANRVATDLATASLAAAGVIEPWPLEVEVGGKKAPTKGLHRINEAALNQLDDSQCCGHRTAEDGAERFGEPLRLPNATLRSVLSMEPHPAACGPG